MKKLALSALFVVLLFGSAVAHDGALSLYTDATIQVCSGPIASFETDTINMYYVRGTGADLGNAVEFRLEASITDAIFLGYEWNSQITVTLGDPLTGISLTASQCLGTNESVVFIGSIFVMYTGFASPPDDRFTVMVKEDPNAQPPAILVTECTPQQPLRAVLGGTFVFNGTCSPAVKESTWGSIKALYK
jgi:hypothetical protein